MIIINLFENILICVNLVCSRYNTDLIYETPFWIENQKRNTSREEKIPTKVTDSNLLNIRKRLAYDIFTKNLNDNKLSLSPGHKTQIDRSEDDVLCTFSLHPVSRG